jgi:hypothetical protein
MIFAHRIKHSDFLIRLRSWEYWPFGIVQLPAIVYWLWLSFRARSLVFFSASNPGIPMGGMFGESKYDILRKIPPVYVPPTVLIDMPVSTAEVLSRIKASGMTLPVIFKPDIGERGFMVRKICSEKDVRRYLADIRSPFLVQELLQDPLEFGVFYCKFPGEECGRVISVVGKEMLAVTGDGKSTLQQLIYRHDRAKLQWKKLKEEHADRLNCIIEDGRRIELVSIGNHAMGTRFINAHHLINDRLSRAFQSISDEIPGFNFGRFDLRCKSLDDLYNGNVKIMELNGCGAEPTHIYDPAFPLWRGIWEMIIHWENIFKIARANNQRGVNYVGHKEAYAFYRKFKSVVK